MLYDGEQLDEFDSMKLDFDDQILFFYQKNIAPISLISSRVFIDKKLLIKDGNVTFMYGTFLPDDHMPHKKDTVRGYGIACSQKFTPQADGTIIFESFMQIDYSVEGDFIRKLADTASLSAFPTSFKDWWKKFATHLPNVEKLESI